MIPFVREMDFAYGQADQVSPLIRRVVANNPGPFTYLGTGTYLIGRGDVAVIDPGPLLDAHLEAILAATAGETITHILTTHTHHDHAPLSHPLQARTGAPIYGLPEPTRQADEGEDDAAARFSPARFLPDHQIKDGQVLEGQGWRLEAIFTPGHASNHVCYALLEENALFCGDHVMGWSTTVISPPDGDMTEYYASLDKIQARNFTTLWPTHGPPILDVAPFIAAYRNHRLARERQILLQLEAGPQTVSEMTPRLYRGLDKRLYGAAARSVLAHMLHLISTRAVVCDGEPGMESYFSTV